jgi:hypothetical protein
LLKKPLCLYGGKIKELQAGDSVLPSLSEGDILYGDADGNLTVLVRGSSVDGSTLKLVDGIPQWVAP